MNIAIDLTSLMQSLKASPWLLQHDQEQNRTLAWWKFYCKFLTICCKRLAPDIYRPPPLNEETIWLD